MRVVLYSVKGRYNPVYVHMGYGVEYVNNLKASFLQSQLTTKII